MYPKDSETTGYRLYFSLYLFFSSHSFSHKHTRTYNIYTCTIPILKTHSLCDASSLPTNFFLFIIVYICVCMYNFAFLLCLLFAFSDLLKIHNIEKHQVFLRYSKTDDLLFYILFIVYFFHFIFLFFYRD